MKNLQYNLSYTEYQKIRLSQVGETRRATLNVHYYLRTGISIRKLNTLLQRVGLIQAKLKLNTTVQSKLNNTVHRI